MYICREQQAQDQHTPRNHVCPTRCTKRGFNRVGTIATKSHQLGLASPNSGWEHGPQSGAIRPRCVTCPPEYTHRCWEQAQPTHVSHINAAVRPARTDSRSALKVPSTVNRTSAVVSQPRCCASTKAMRCDPDVRRDTPKVAPWTHTEHNPTTVQTRTAPHAHVCMHVTQLQCKPQPTKHTPVVNTR